MAPEYGATCGIFPVDHETLRYLRLTGRTDEPSPSSKPTSAPKGLFHTADAPEADYTPPRSRSTWQTVEPSVAGPKRPQDRVLLSEAASSFQQQLPTLLGLNGNKGAISPDGRGGRAKAATCRPRARRSNELGPVPPTRPPSAHLTKAINRVLERQRRRRRNGHTPAQPAPTTVKARFGVNPDDLPRPRLASSSPPSPPAPTPRIPT